MLEPINRGMNRKLRINWSQREETERLKKELRKLK
jgi:hypothetical protein